jgi:hypothetical protein
MYWGLEAPAGEPNINKKRNGEKRRKKGRKKRKGEKRRKRQEGVVLGVALLEQLVCRLIIKKECF